MRYKFSLKLIKNNIPGHFMRRLLTTLITFCVFTHYCFAAQNTKYNISSGSEFIFESYPNQELIPIRLLGAIKNAGLYHIPPNMKLITLLSLAGGTTNEADLENIVIGNDQQNVVSRSGEEKKSLTVNLEETLKNGAKADYTLMPNDIILINNRSPLISNDSFRIITIMSVLLTSLLTAVIINDKYSK
jgi:hypothetical protein